MAARVPGMTMQQTANGIICANHSAMLMDYFNGVMRASRVEAALLAKVRA